MDVRIHDGMLCARTDGRIPKVCLLCGATRDVVRRTQEYPVGTSYGASAGAGGGVVGALVAQSLRGLDHMVAATAIVGLVAVVAVGAWLAHRATPKITIELPLCTACDGRWAEAQQRQTWFIIAIGVFLGLVVTGIALDAMWLLGAALAWVLALVAFALVTEQAKRFLHVGFVTKTEIGFRVSKEIGEKVVERARRRAAREEQPAATSPGGEPSETGEPATEGT